MKEIFKLKEPTYNLRSDSSHFMQRKIKTTSYGLQPLEYLAPKISDLVPQDIKNCKTVNAFKSQKKSWYPNQCPNQWKTHPNQCPNQWRTHIQISVQINEKHTSKSVSKSMKNKHPNQCPNQWKTHIQISVQINEKHTSYK